MTNKTLKINQRNSLRLNDVFITDKCYSTAAILTIIIIIIQVDEATNTGQLLSIGAYENHWDSVTIYYNKDGSEGEARQPLCIQD